MGEMKNHDLEILNVAHVRGGTKFPKMGQVVHFVYDLMSGISALTDPPMPRCLLKPVNGCDLFPMPISFKVMGDGSK